ncbi:MAG: 1-acyl-sn-glycerol-3-phosphate acyltransferase [Desulfovibrio sp.]|nr:MAG: 1-acyl-sn-glycerol-3-phosphate acyltransferase [Desulfovibrio sp.]
MLRNIIFLIFFIPYAVFFFITAVLIGWVDRSLRLYMYLYRAWTRPSLFVGRVRVERDLAAIPRQGPVIYMCNHQSYLDILVLYGYLGHLPFGYVAKDSLAKVPFLGQAMAAAGCVFINRDNPRQAMRSIDKAVQHTKKGWSILIFPEGTRGTDPEDFLDFQVGGMVLALKTGLPIVPIVCTGTGVAMPRTGLLFAKGKHTIRVKAMEPIETQGKYTLKDREKLKTDLRELMLAQFKEMLGEQKG